MLFLCVILEKKRLSPKYWMLYAFIHIFSSYFLLLVFFSHFPHFPCCFAKLNHTPLFIFHFFYKVNITTFSSLLSLLIFHFGFSLLMSPTKTLLLAQEGGETSLCKCLTNWSEIAFLCFAVVPLATSVL